jgi:multidrug resistance efflux pump
MVIEGDRVTAGQTLCRFDRRDLDQREAELLAELAVLERTKDRAMAENAPVEVQLARANQELARARLDIVRSKIADAAPQAPFDGMVVAGDLRKRVGSVLARGEPLFAIAPLERLTLQMHVPESASADLAVGLSGTFATYARPEYTRTVTIQRVLGQAQIREDKNVFVAEADFGAADGWTRPGMEGLARIAVGPRRIWWVALHNVVDYVRMKLWL